MRSQPFCWTNLLKKLGLIRRKRSSGKQTGYRRGPCCEQLEERRMLAVMADVVFLMDESGSNDEGPVYTWLKDMVFASASGQPNPIASELASQGITDVRYGLVGFGGSGEFNDGRAHSYIVNAVASDPLFGTAAQMDAAMETLFSVSTAKTAGMPSSM